MARCAHCRSPKATNAWDMRLCADAGRHRERWLCDACDVTLNRLVLEFMKDPKTEAKMKNYQERKR